MKYITGNKTYSSWSLRPWILLKHFGIPFEEILVKLDLPGTTVEIKKYSPSGRVPALVDGTLVIWESLAIMEYLNEKFPDRQMYPVSQRERAICRSISNEMHGGFAALREHLSFNTKRKSSKHNVDKAVGDIARIKQIWNEQLGRSNGPFLFGKFSIADAMYAPVVGRFKIYEVPVDGQVAEYCKTMMELPAMKEWYADAQRETFNAPYHD
ncbi:MAG: glutathione S-transferase family protein [Bdellovibrionota bacterium]